VNSLPIIRQENLEAVRRKPGMYIGGTDGRALTRCVLELVRNSLGEHLSGRCNSIKVILHQDGSISVQDDGPGISVVFLPEHCIPFIELVLTTLHCGTLEPSRLRYTVSRGVGAKCVNAVSEWMQVNTTQESAEYRINFTRGRTTESLRKVRETGAPPGTTFRFKPDPEIFPDPVVDRAALAMALEPLAMLHPGLELTLVDERSDAHSSPAVSRFYRLNGIADSLKTISPDGQEFCIQPDPITFHGDRQEIKYAVGFRFLAKLETQLRSFVNSSPAELGGTHVDGFLSGLTTGLNQVAGHRRKFRRGETQIGLHAVVSVWLAEPKFNGATREELINPEARSLIREFTLEAVERWISESQESAERVIDFLDAKRR
jgi:DNA gyrase subunit B